MPTFKPGDKVYYPTYSDRVYTVEKATTSASGYPIAVGNTYFTADGKFNGGNKVPLIFHATEENRTKLEELHGIKLEPAPIPPTSREIIYAMLARGDKSVPCWVSHSHEKPVYINRWAFICSVSETFFTDADGVDWEYATPFDHKTEQPITELPA